MGTNIDKWRKGRDREDVRWVDGGGRRLLPAPAELMRSAVRTSQTWRTGNAGASLEQNDSPSQLDDVFLFF